MGDDGTAVGDELLGVPFPFGFLALQAENLKGRGVAAAHRGLGRIFYIMWPSCWVCVLKTRRSSGMNRLGQAGGTRRRDNWQVGCFVLIDRRS